MKKQRKKTGILLGLAILVVALPGTFFGYRMVRWHGMLARADKIQDQLELEDSARPVLWGKSQSGDAWQDYSQAIETLSSAAEKAWLDYLRACRTSSAAEARLLRDALLLRNREALVSLQDGAHRERSRAPIDWHLGLAGSVPNLLSYRTLSNLAVLEGERYLDAGQPGPAVEMFLDVMQLGRDHLQTPRVLDEMIGAALLGIGLEALIERGNLDRLGPTQLVRLESGLRRLDASIPEVGKGLLGESVLFARTVAGSGLPDPWAKKVTWEWGFSQDLLSADHAERYSAQVATYERLRGTPWPELRPALVTCYQALRASDNPISSDQAVDLVYYGSVRRQVIAKLRMIRMVVDQRRGQEILPLPDPFGSELGYEVDGDELSIWSLGRDGTTAERDRVKIPLTPARPSAARPSGR